MTINLQSGHAALDVQRGRVKLLDHIKKGGKCEVVIKGTIERELGNDDGVSREFVVDVSSVEACLTNKE